MGDGTKENPFTPEDVRRLIDENGGTANGLDLSGKHFNNGIDLSGLKLNSIIFRESVFPVLFEHKNANGAKFDGSGLVRADFRNAELEYAQFKNLENTPTKLLAANFRGSNLMAVSFQNANLTSAQFGESEDKNLTVARLDDTDFRGANLVHASFKGCYFYGTKLEGAFIRGADILQARLDEADWGNYIIGEEKENEFYFAEQSYRHLKMWYNNSGYYDIGAKFYYREKEANRKSIKLRSKHWNDRLAAEFMRALFGYGERWKRILFWIAGFIVFFAIIYCAIGSVWEWWAFWNSLYFSAVSFTALGYGSWVSLNNELTNDIIRGLGAFESVLGVSMVALLLVTFFRKWTR